MNPLNKQFGRLSLLFYDSINYHRKLFHVQSSRRNIISAYQSQVRSFELQSDHYQRKVVRYLQQLDDQMKKTNVATNKQGMLQRIWTRKVYVRGLYLHGSLGCGKSTILSLFYKNCSIEPEHVRRVNFDSFMMEFHRRMHRYKQAQQKTEAVCEDSIELIADQLCQETRVLCLDDLDVNDVGNAMIMKSLFEKLFARGMVMICASERRPEELYLNGTQRELFVSFIPLIRQYCRVFQIASNIDYRLLSQHADQQLYFVKEVDTDQKLDAMFNVLANEESYPLESKTFDIGGRKMTFEVCCGRMMDTTFDVLCNQPLGPIDYLTLGNYFHTIFIRDVPRLTSDDLVLAKRFITLIDIFYEEKVRVVISSKVPRNKLFSLHLNTFMFPQGELDFKVNQAAVIATMLKTKEIYYESMRTQSRLTEMQSKKYWNKKRENLLEKAAREIQESKES